MLERGGKGPFGPPISPAPSLPCHYFPSYTRTFSPNSTRVNVNVCRWGLDPRTAGATVSAKSFSIYWPRNGQTWATIWEERELVIGECCLPSKGKFLQTPPHGEARFEAWQGLARERTPFPLRKNKTQDKQPSPYLATQLFPHLGS